MAGLRDLIKKRMDAIDKVGETPPEKAPAPQPAATKVATPPITADEAAKKAARFKWERENPGVPYKEPQPGKANGGLVKGVGTGTSDSNLVPMSKGEFVLPADTVKKLGVSSLRELVKETHTPVPGQPKGLANGDGYEVTESRSKRAMQQFERIRAKNAAAQAAAAEEAAARGMPKTPSSAIDVKNASMDTYNKARGVQTKLNPMEASQAAQARTTGLREGTKALAEQAVGRARIAAGSVTPPAVTPSVPRTSGLGVVGPALGAAAEAYGAKSRVDQGMAPQEAYPRAVTNFAAGMASAKLADALVTPVANAVQTFPMRGAGLAATGLRAGGKIAGYVAGAAGMDEFADRQLQRTGKQMSPEEAATNARYAEAIPADWPKDVPHPAQFKLTRDEAGLYGPTNTVPGKMPAVPPAPTADMAASVAEQEQHGGVRSAPVPIEQQYKNAADVPPNLVPQGGGFASSDRMGMRAYTKDTMPAPMGVTDTTSPEVKAADMANREKWKAEAAAIDQRMADRDRMFAERGERADLLNRRNVADYERRDAIEKLKRGDVYSPAERRALELQYKNAGYGVLEAGKGIENLDDRQSLRERTAAAERGAKYRDDMGLRGQMYQADQKLIGDAMQASATSAKANAELTKLQRDMRKDNRKAFNDWAQTTFVRPVLDKNGQVTSNVFDPNQLNSFVRDVYAKATSNPKFLAQFGAKSVEDLNDADWRVIYDDYAQNMTITNRVNATRDAGDGVIAGVPVEVGIRPTKAMDWYSTDREAPNAISLRQSLSGAMGFGNKADQLTATIRGADGNAQRRILSDLVGEDPREVKRILTIMARTDPENAKKLEAELFDRKK